MSVDERSLGDELGDLLTLCEVCYYNHLRAQSLREEGREGFDDKFVADCKRSHELARARLLAHVSGVPPSEHQASAPSHADAPKEPR